MRTLDEVIEIASDWTNGFDESSIEKQMLHYLKEYQQTVKWVEINAEQFEQTREFIRKATANNPLTWDELKQMVGKPVWVEYNLQIGDKEFRDKSKRWCIIGEFKPWKDTEITITKNGFVLSKREQINDWQAYRKERS